MSKDEFRIQDESLRDAGGGSTRGGRQFQNIRRNWKDGGTKREREEGVGVMM